MAGEVSYGAARYGLAWRGAAGEARSVADGQGVLGLGKARQAGSGKVWFGLEW